MQLKQQYLGTVQPKVSQPQGLSATTKTVLVLTATGLMLVVVDASASPTGIDLISSGLTALPGDAGKIYTQLTGKVIPLAVAAAAGLAAMRGAMSFIMGLVASALRAG